MMILWYFPRRYTCTLLFTTRKCLSRFSMVVHRSTIFLSAPGNLTIKTSPVLLCGDTTFHVPKHYGQAPPYGTLLKHLDAAKPAFQGGLVHNSELRAARSTTVITCFCGLKQLSQKRTVSARVKNTPVVLLCWFSFLNSPLYPQSTLISFWHCTPYSDLNAPAVLVMQPNI